MQKTKIEILDWIASLYNINNRSVGIFKDSGKERCMYNGPDGKHCAMAIMCIHPEQLIECADEDGMVLPDGYTAQGIAIEHPEWIKEEFRGYPPNFYQSCQSLHDNEDNWNESGLSEVGKRKLASLKEYYS